MRRLTLDQKFQLCSLVIVLITAALAGQLIYHSYREFRLNQKSLENLSLYHAVLDAANVLAAERGETFRLISDLRVHNYPQRRAVAQARQRSDGELKQIAALIKRHQEDFVVSIQAVDHARRDLTRARELADSVADKPLARRGGTEITQVIDELYYVANDLRPAIIETGMHSVETDRRISYAVVMSRMLGLAREHAGRVGAQLMVPLIKREAIGADRQQRIGNFRERLNDMAEGFKQQMSNYRMQSGLQQAREAMERDYFGEGYRLLDEVLQQGSHSGDRLPSVMAFTERYTHAMRSVEQMQERLIQAAAEQSQQGVVNAKREAVQVLLLCGALIGVLIALLYTSRRRLLLPLLQARHGIIELAEGNLMPLRRPRSGPEVEKLFDALDTLRSSQEKRVQAEQRLSQLTQQLKRQAETDVLTGVHNRRALEDIGEQLLTHAALGDWRVGLVMFDIDHFKKVNDVHGHPVGDLVLKMVAQTVLETCRNEDNVGRFGGEEFIVLVPLADAKAVRAVAEKLRRVIAGASVQLPGGRTLSVTASFGVSLSCARSTWGDLVSEADTALYQAKHSGRNCVVGLEPAENSASAA
ncbi:GGDEF domain-containing protein [Chitiniphilus eburneus]|uniref:diguanylate cyclase n=1 Tax=Chitiniphilus eburneus TaxID=2571148 RepID=A0A4U0PZX1_9NEIS|nr:GGDEF domain-containing protein [Chitiniphilus eburneus]TJZ74187.1 GGDEF domain-containing protein [Chitiniphilus eburneus]